MYKSKLQELCHKNDWDLPVYATLKDGADHCPRFTSTVTVQGKVFESPKNLCKSSKEAQNFAAKIAFDYFDSGQTQPVSPAITAPSPLTLPSPGFVNVKPIENRKLQQKQGQDARTSLADQSLISRRDENTPKDLHVYKNRLQHYAQKNNLTLPEYSCEVDGPPHARQFRASVKIGGSTYTSPIYFATLKDSEHAAAKVAFESLSVGEVQEDEGLYKTLLQELAQKEGFHFPSYTTTVAGPPHMPTFVSTVEIGGESFHGRECRTKKLSEMNAAKVAYNALMERCYFLPGDNKKVNTEVRAGRSQPITSCGNKGPNNATETHAELAAMGIGEIHPNSGVLSPDDLKIKDVISSVLSPSSLDSVVTYHLQQDVQPKSMPSVNENDGKARERSAHGLEESDVEKPVVACASCGTKIVVRPRNSTIKIPEGATIMPYSDDKWLAVKVEENQRQ